MVEDMEFPSRLKVAFIANNHIFQMTKNDDKLKISGIEGRLLQILSTFLRFHFDLVSPSKREWGRLESDGNWSGLIGLVANQEADLAMSTLTMSEDRLQAVDFSSPYTIQDVTFLVESPGLIHDANHLFRPFGLAVWASILFVLVAIPAVFVLLVRGRLSYTRLLFELLGSLLKQPVMFERAPAKVEVLFCLWSFFTLVVSSCYSSILLSYLTLPLQERPIRSFEELSSAVRERGYRCLCEKGSSIPKILLSSEQPHLRFLGETMEKNGWYFQMPDLADGKISIRKTAILNINLKLQMISALLKTDAIEIASDVLASWKIALAVRKGFCCKRRLDTMLARMSGAGLFDKLQADEWYALSLSTEKKTRKQNVAQKLSFMDIFSSFLVLGSGCLVSAIMLLGELACFRMRTRGSYRRRNHRKCHKRFNNKSQHRTIIKIVKLKVL